MVSTRPLRSTSAVGLGLASIGESGCHRRFNRRLAAAGTAYTAAMMPSRAIALSRSLGAKENGSTASQTSNPSRIQNGPRTLFL
jgi:hypothetical protein